MGSFARVGHIEQALTFANHMRVLGGYVATLLSLEEEGRELVFLWDHEMIHEIMFPSSAKSPYSGLLWLGLESLREGSTLTAGAEWRVILPEGTRVELQASLKGLVNRYESLLRRFPESKSELLETSLSASRLREFSQQPEYRSVVRLALQLQNLDHAVARLLVFLEKYARPMPMPSSAILRPHVEHYTERLQRERKFADDLERNQADALNLASAEIVSENPDLSPALITATGAVLRQGRPWARDPMFFALAGHFRQRNPNPDSRRRILAQMSAFIQNLAVRTENLTLEAQPVKKREVSEFLRALENLKNDPLFLEISLLTAETHQAVSSAFSQAQRLAADLTELRIKHGGSPQALMTQLVEALDSESVSLMDLKWVPSTDVGDEELGILSQGGATVIEAARIPDGVALAWESLDTLEEFLSGVSKFGIEGNSPPIEFFCRYASRPGVLAIALGARTDFINILRESGGDEKATLLWIDAGRVKFWFDPGDLHFESHGPNRRRTRLAIHLYDPELANLTAMWICRTAARFIPTKELVRHLDNLLSGAKSSYVSSV